MTPTRAGRVVAVVGPTATGKSAAALEIATSAEHPVEVVAVDALTVYRGMDVGTAKPTAAERARVPHHLVDVLDPWEEASVAWFQRAARDAIGSVLDRGSVAVLVGGSGLYFRAVVDDLVFPPTDPEVRAGIERRYGDDPPEAHAALAAVDPDAAAKIDPANLRRSVRALEVVELTGEPFSAFAAAWDRYESVYPDLVVWGLDGPDEQLRERIVARAEAMLAAGLLDEARRLRTDPRGISRTAAQAIGYAEAFVVLAGEAPEADLVPAIVRRTWRYAQRQRAWFRRDPRVRWTTLDNLPRVV